jgi:energy-coupling factor transport system permease protein
MRFALYVEPPTAVHRLHPVTKLLGLASLYLAAFMVDDPRYLAPVGLIPIGLLVAAGAASLIRRFGRTFVVIFVFTVAVWTTFGPGWQVGLSSAMRIGVFFMMGLLLLATTRVEEIAYGLGRLGVPYKAGFTLTLAFRLVPLFFDAAGTILDAQRCRGLRLAEGGPLTRLRRFVPVLVPVFVGALRRGDRMAMALELRGFNSGRPRTTYLRARTNGRDVLALAVVAAIAATYLRFWWLGMGALARRRRGARDAPPC